VKSSDDGDAGPEGTTSAPATTTVPAANGGATDGAGDATTGGQAASLARRSAPRLTGTFTVKRGQRLSVQRRDAGGWRTVGHARVGRGGRYAATLPGPGTYRVTLGDLAGPAVNVR
jgi:hypothetical protein